MDTGRAKQILESPREIGVQYNGSPIWIQQVDETANTARVYLKNDPDNEMTVNVTQLDEL
ncbi:H-type small acid-soluble spore protein [Pseudalkalibacillus decolorationis]|uniref:H-type small acid-soluble spore protein n=1 Tax=Pseudalkalibacillus decolorationis TaxID=163879 RepID=UPI002148EEA6|nr:H-type small acid-soluble spore protein [Pseudalkalibacillus decolorationis]